MYFLCCEGSEEPQRCVQGQARFRLALLESVYELGRRLIAAKQLANRFPVWFLHMWTDWVFQNSWALLF